MFVETKQDQTVKHFAVSILPVNSWGQLKTLRLPLNHHLHLFLLQPNDSPQSVSKQAAVHFHALTMKESELRDAGGRTLYMFHFRSFPAF